MSAPVPPTDAIIRDWLKALAALVAASMSGEEISARIGALTPHLAAEFPRDAFCRASLTAVARQCRFFPNFAELCEALTAWVKQHRESRRLLALPSPRAESREPYKLPPPPPERSSRHFGRPDREEIRELIQKPLRSVAQQLAELGFAEPLKVAAAPIRAETRRGPPIDA